jgi:hypothetical protein
MFHCIYSLEDFEIADGEHILQNFLGARWTSHEIVCNELQSQFGTTIDAALEEGLKPIRNLLGTLGGRRDAGPPLRNLPATTGEILDLQPGAKPRLREPVIQEHPLPDGRIQVKAQLGKRNHLNWVFAKIREKYPNAHIDEAQAASSARAVRGFVDGSVTLSVDLGGDDYFRGMLKACFNLLGVTYRHIVFQPCFDPVRKFIKDGVGRSARFIRWVEFSERLATSQVGPADQAIFIVSREKSVEGVVQFFGDIVHAFQLTDAYDGPPLRCGYVVDPFREAQPAEDRNPSFESQNIPEFPKQALTNTAAATRAFRARLERIVTLYYERSQRQMIEATIRDVLRENGGAVFTEQMANQVAERLARQALRLPTSQGDTPESDQG